MDYSHIYSTTQTPFTVLKARYSSALFLVRYASRRTWIDLFTIKTRALMAALEGLSDLSVICPLSASDNVQLQSDKKLVAEHSSFGQVSGLRWIRVEPGHKIKVIAVYNTQRDYSVEVLLYIQGVECNT